MPQVTALQYEPDGRNGSSTFTIVVEDGELKVGEHRYAGDPR